MEQAAPMPASISNSTVQPTGCPMTSMANSTVELKFIKSPWSTPCLVLDNFLYNCHSTRGDIGYWRCHNYSRKNKEERCRARCVVKNGRLSALTGAQHNHLPHTEKIERIVRRNHADELQEREMLRVRQQLQQQQQHQDLQQYQRESEIKSQTNVQTGENILLLMAAAPASACSIVSPQTEADADQKGQPLMRNIRQQGTLEVSSATQISSVTTVLAPAMADLIKMEEYDLPTVEM